MSWVLFVPLTSCDLSIAKVAKFFPKQVSIKTQLISSISFLLRMMASYVNSNFSAKVGTVSVISLDRFQYFCLSCSHQFEVFGTRLEKGDVIYSAPIRIKRYLNQNLLTVAFVTWPLSVKSDQTTLKQSWWSKYINIECSNYVKLETRFSGWDRLQIHSLVLLGCYIVNHSLKTAN